VKQFWRNEARSSPVGIFSYPEKKTVRIVMKKMLTAVVIVCLISKGVAQTDYSTQNGHVSFFSEAPVANVDAKNDKVKAILNISTSEITFHLSMAEFEFHNQKMGRDAQDKYLETAKYTTSDFKGKINGKIDYHKSGTYPVTATGKLKIHGIERQVTERGKITVESGKIRIQSEFRLVLKDFKIDTPKILGHEMTQDYVLVKIDATLKEQTNTASKK
jgi:polyisoprenoid-binding protein YceI